MIQRFIFSFLLVSLVKKSSIFKEKTLLAKYEMTILVFRNDSNLLAFC